MEPTDKEQADLVAYLDGELDAPSARVVEAKLNQDPRVRGEADALKRPWHLFDFLPRPKPPANFTSCTLERLSAQRARGGWFANAGRWRPWVIGLGWMAAVVVAGSLGYASGTLLAHRQSPGVGREVDPRLVRDLRAAPDGQERF